MKAQPLIAITAALVTAAATNSHGGAPSTVSITQKSGKVSVSFTGSLERASELSGPWLKSTNAASPIELPPAAAHEFFRVRPEESIFSSRSIVLLTMTGPLQTHFDLAYAGTPDGIFPPHREKSYFDATLQLDALALPVTARVRGNSSLQECSFPKLKFKVSSKVREGTPFSDAREVNIGTHCAEGGRGGIGRLRDERATFREALAYETMELLGFITPRVRRARFEYRDTSSTNQAPSGGWQISRNAVLLESVEVVGERLGGRALEDEEIEALEKPNFDPQLTVDLRLFHALLGNWDYNLTVEGRGLWNTDVLELGRGQLVPVAGDFDLASWVTGTVRLDVPPEYRPDLPDLERQVLYTTSQIRQSISAAAFQAAVERFTSQRAVIENQIATAEVDEEGRTNAMRHVAAFYNALAAVGERSQP